MDLKAPTKEEAPLLHENVRILEERYEVQFTRRERILALLGFLTLLGTNLTTLWILSQRSPENMAPPTLREELEEEDLVRDLRGPDLVETIAAEYGLDPFLIRSLIFQESCGNPLAVSPKGAQGLMQIMEPTWAEVCRKIGVDWDFSQSVDPSKNLRVGCFYLRYLINWAESKGYTDPLRTAIIAYNCGMGRVARGEIPPASQEFADRVLAYQGDLGNLVFY